MNMVNQQLTQISTFSQNNLRNNLYSEGNFLFVFYEF